MRIERIVLKNYRQFKDVAIDFQRAADNDLSIIIGENGTGKTNILNAINWCFYGDEPHLSRKSQQQPRVNMAALEDAEDGRDVNIQVEVWMVNAEGEKFRFQREEQYRVYRDQPQPSRQDSKFKVLILASNEEGNSEIIEDKDVANAFVERFVPKDIREFFFFDGERLDDYFKEAAASNVRHSVSVISQINVLEEMERKLKELRNELRKQAGKENPDIETIRKGLEEKERELEEKKKREEHCKQEQVKARKAKDSIGEQLRGAPDVDKLQEEKEGLKTRKKNREKHRVERGREKRDHLFEAAILIGLWDAIEKSINIIDEERKRKRIPPPIHSDVLRDAIEKGECVICGRPLEGESERLASELLASLEQSSDVAQQLLEMESHVKDCRRRIEDAMRGVRKASKDIREDEKELESIEKKIQRIDKQMSGHNEAKIRRLYQQRRVYEEIYDARIKDLGILSVEIRGLEDDIEELSKKMDEMTRKGKRLSELRKQMSFCEAALTAIEKTKKEIMANIRKTVEEETNKVFSQLTWKGQTFEQVQISDDYDVKLIHQMGYECLGTVSAAERQLLALSFTLALHTVSGFDAPILIDTPVSRTSGEHRTNLGRTFAEISRKKQTILLLTPAEYSAEIRGILDRVSAKKFRLRMSSDEKETVLEEL